MRLHVVPLASIAILAACGNSQVEPTIVTSEEALTASRYGFTGVSLYAVQPYMLNANSTYVRTNTVLNRSLSPVSGLGPNGPSVFGSSLGGVGVDGTLFGGLDLVDAAFAATDADGGEVRLVIDGIAPGQYPNDDVLYYDVRAETEDGAAPLCGLDSDGAPITALALPGRWDQNAGSKGAGGWVDTDTFFFACRGSSVAKCFEMGFKPWKIAGHGKKIVSQHEACVRALRADYCGDGTSHTVAGVEVSLWTEVGDAPDDDHAFEAQWGSDGVRCLSTTRVPRGGLPSCVKKLKKCKESRSANVVLMSGFAQDNDEEASGASDLELEDDDDSKKPKKPKK